MSRPGRVKLHCAQCAAEFSVINGRAKTAKFCSRECADKHPRPKRLVRCKNCGSLFHRKASQSIKVRTETCSYACSNAMRSVYFAGAGNPNYRGRNTDSDGYRIYVPWASGIDLGFRKSIKMHHAVAFIELGITSLPKATHVHHRDCDALNNDAENLALLTEWDHKWLHKQFGVAPLIAFMRGSVDIQTLSGWSDDPARAEFLLRQNVVDQGRELREMGGYSESNLESVLMGYRWHDPFDNPMAQIIINALNMNLAK